MGPRKLVTFGEVLMRLSTVGNARFGQAESFNTVYGGAEANVATSLAGFGIPCEFVTQLPNNDFGRNALKQLKAHDIATDHVSFAEARMGLYFLETGALHRPTRIIYDRSDSAFSRIQPFQFDWDEILKDAAWFHWTGITPAISGGAASECKEALYAAKRHNVMVSADINFRRNLWQYGKPAIDIMPELISLSHYILAGVDDIQISTQLKAEGFPQASQLLVETFPNVKAVAMSSRKSINAGHNRIAAELYSNGVHLRSREHDLPGIVDRIGAGDALMAGLIYGFMTGMSDQETLEFAAAAGAWKHSVEGDHNVATVEEISGVAEGEVTGRLWR